MLAGKELWQNSQELEKKFLSEYNKEFGTSFTSYKQLIPHYEVNAFKVLSRMYKQAVIDDKVTEKNLDDEIFEICRDKAKGDYDSERGDNERPFNELTLERQKEIIQPYIDSYNKSKRVVLRDINASKSEKIASKTIERILNLQKENKIKKDSNGAPVLTTFDILFNIANSKYKQEDYLIEQELENWYANFCGIPIPKTADGKINMDAEIYVYCFQNGDIGASNFIKFDGRLGPEGKNGGYFVISEASYNKLKSDPNLFNKVGICNNIADLSANLGNVPLGSNPICVRRKISLRDLQTTHGELSTAYFGEFGPPLSTQGGWDEKGNYINGMSEAVVPSTTIWSKDITIINHSANITNQQLNMLIEKLFKKIQIFLVKENATKLQENLDTWTLINNLDKDIELLNRFKKELSKREQAYLSKLMVHLQNVMQREEVNTAGKGAM